MDAKDMPSGMLDIFLNSLDSCTALVDAEGALRVVNNAWRNYPGCNPFVSGVAVGEDFLGVLDRLASSNDGNLVIVAMGLKAMFKGKVPRLRLEYPVKREITSWFGVVAVRSEDKVVLHFSDLTERMGVMQRLHKAETLFKATSEHALDLISVLDRKGGSVFMSNSHQKVLGYSEQNWKGLTLTDLIHPDDHEGYLRAVGDAFSAGLSAFFEYRVKHKTGEWRTFEGRAAVIENAPATRDAVLLISRDITGRKAAELERASMEVQLRQAQKLEAVGQLAAGIAHEINTPAQYITDNVRFLEEAFASLCEILKEEGGLLAAATQDTALAGRAQGVLEKIQTEDLDYLMEEVPRAIQQSLEGLQRVSGIVKAMKIFSHPGVEGLAGVDLNQAVESTLTVSRNEWKYVADVDMQLDPDLPSVSCYPGEINQLLLNLIINAAHAIEAVVGTSGAKGLIRIRTRLDGDWAEIQVEDTGTGIPEKIRDQIFVPFFTTKSVGKGTGQGLAIVHSVVTKHKGKVTFQSEEGKGTCFTVRLPLSP